MKTVFSPCLGLLKPLRWILARLAIFTAILALTDIAKPYLVGQLVDLAGRGDFSLPFYRLLAALGLLLLSGEISAALKALWAKGLSSRLQMTLSLKTFNRIYSQPCSLFLGKNPGESFYQATQDVERATAFIAENAGQLPYLALRALLTLLVMFSINARLAFLATALLPLMLLPQQLLRKKILAAWDALIHSGQDFFSLAEELFAGSYLVKALGKEKTALRRFSAALARTLKAEMTGLRVELWLGAASRLAAMLCAAAFLLYALKLLQEQAVSAGMLTALAIYILQLNALATQAAELLPEIALGAISFRRLGDIFQSASAQPSRAAVTTGAAVLDNVSFSYDPEKPVLKNASISISHGRHTALAGPSGCGKTTVFNLLIGLYEPVAGEISIDGAPPAPGRPGLALSPQESFFWNDSLKNNLLFAAPSANEEEIALALKLTGLDSVSAGLPEGERTVLGHNAARLSRGQKQRLALARALLAKPRLLLLDEALSSLDPESERHILSAIRTAIPGLTILSATHRPQSLLLADTACVFDVTGGIACGLTPAQALERMK